MAGLSSPHAGPGAPRRRLPTLIRPACCPRDPGGEPPPASWNLGWAVFSGRGGTDPGGAGYWLARLGRRGARSPRSEPTAAVRVTAHMLEWRRGPLAQWQSRCLLSTRLQVQVLYGPLRIQTRMPASRRAFLSISMTLCRARVGACPACRLALESRTRCPRPPGS
jgi:hypothetical protein